VDPESILVVDDDRDVASTVSEYLTREGHTVILAHSGRDGLTRLREGAVALLLVDLRLPDMDGIEVMHAAQRAPNPPEIVVITGYATVSSAVQAVEGGTAGYLEKPFEMPRLAAIVQRVMGRRRLMRENMHLQAETASRLREMEVMLSISRTASATLDVQEALRRICRELVFLVGADTGAAYLLDEPSGRLMPTAGYHVPKEMMEAFLSHPIPLGEQGFRQEIWETRQPVFSDDVYSDPRFNFELFRTFRHQSGLVLPLLLDDSVAGAFYFAWWKAKKVFTRRELELAENVAAQVTMVLRHARLFERADREWRQLQVLFDALDREGAREHGFHACLGVPLQIQGQILGCLNVYAKVRRKFSPEDISLLSVLGDQAALAIHKAQLYEETRAQKEEATKLYGITAHLATTLDVDSVLDQVVAKTIDLLGCDASAVYVHDEARGGLVVRRGRHLDPAIVRDLVLKPGEGVAGRAYQERRPVSTADRLADPALRYQTDHDRLIQSAPRAYLAVPVSVRDEVLGVLVCYYFAAHQFSAKEAQLLSSLAAHAAIAMDNARHHQAVMLQQNRLSQIFDATSDGMLLVSPAGRVETANRRAGDLLAIKASDLVGNELTEVLAWHRAEGADYRRMFSALRSLVQHQEDAAEGDLELRSLKRILHWVSQPTRDRAGEHCGYTLTFHDVTHEREVSQMKSDFVSFVTHQLRTPLAGIKWMLELAAQEPEVPADAASYIGDAREADPAPDHARERAARHLPAGARQAHGVDPAGGSRDHDPRGARGDRRPRAGAPASGLRLHRGSPAPRGARRRAAAPPGGHEPGLERDQVHPGRRGHRGPVRAGRRHAALVHPRQRHRHPALFPGAAVREVLPGREREHARDRGHRPRVLPRAPDHGAARRPRLVRVGGGRGLDLPLHAAARGARRVTSGRRVLLGDRVAGILEG